MPQTHGGRPERTDRPATYTISEPSITPLSEELDRRAARRRAEFASRRDRTRRLREELAAAREAGLRARQAARLHHARRGGGRR